MGLLRVRLKDCGRLLKKRGQVQDGGAGTACLGSQAHAKGALLVSPMQPACSLKGVVVLISKSSVGGASCDSLRLLTAGHPGASLEEISAPIPLQVHRMPRDSF